MHPFLPASATRSAVRIQASSSSFSPSSLRGVLHQVSEGSRSLSLTACSASFLAHAGAGVTRSIASGESDEVPGLHSGPALLEGEAIICPNQIDEFAPRGFKYTVIILAAVS